MRVSADPHSPYYSKDSVTRCTVFLNGSETHKVIEADEDEGWILRYVTDARGHVVPIKHAPGHWEAQKEKVYGTVKIVVEEQGQA